MSINTTLTISVFNAVRFVILEVTLGLFIPLLATLYSQQRAITQILRGKGWKPGKGKHLSWRLNLTSYSSIILSVIALSIGLALEYGSGELEVDIIEVRSTDVWSTTLDTIGLPYTTLSTRREAEYGIYTSLASKFTRITRANETNTLTRNDYIVHISPFYTTGLTEKMYPPNNVVPIIEDPLVEFEAYSRNETEISVSFEDRPSSSSRSESEIIKIKEDGEFFAGHDIPTNYLVRKDNETAICNIDASVPRSATSGNADVTCLYYVNDSITLIGGTMQEEQFSAFHEGSPTRFVINTNVYTIQAPKQRSKTIDSIILYHFRDNSARNKGTKGLTDGSGLHVMRSISLLLHVGTFFNETIQEPVKVGVRICASVEKWAIILWLISTTLAVVASLVIWMIVRRSQLKVNVTKTSGMFLIAEDMASRSEDCNNPYRKTSNKVVLVERGSSVHLTIADPELAVVYKGQEIVSDKISLEYD